MDDDDFEEDDMMDEPNTGKSGDGRPIVRHVVKDVRSAMKLRQITTKAEARSEMARIRADERKRKHELKADIARLRLRMTAREAASKHIAIFGPLYLMLLVGMFLVALGTGMITTDQTPVVASLLTLLITMIGANLRSIVSEGNGHDDGGDDAPTRKPTHPPTGGNR